MQLLLIMGALLLLVVLVLVLIVRLVCIVMRVPLIGVMSRLGTGVFGCRGVGFAILVSARRVRQSNHGRG